MTEPVSSENSSAELRALTNDNGPWLCDVRALSTGALYLALSLLLFGRELLHNFSALHIGMFADPALMMWLLVWWPHAIRHGLNPVLTHTIWAPAGFNLAWGSSIPLAAIAFAPLTLSLGPVATYNILCLTCLALNAWCAFTLFRYLTGSYWASLLGGYIFGFSPFMLGQLLFGHVHMLLAFPIPLAVYLAARRINSDIGERRFTLFLAVLLAAQLLMSLEIFATMTMIAAIAIFLGWPLSNSSSGQVTTLLLKPVVLSYAIALALASPYLYYFFFFGFTRPPVQPLGIYVADVLNFIVPTQTSALGLISYAKHISVHFSGSASESGAYFGLPLLTVVALYGYRHWQAARARAEIECLMIICVLSLGSMLHIGGHQVAIPLPWRVVEKLPLFNDVLPARLSMYAFLVVALIAVRWLSDGDYKRSIRLAMAVAIVAFSLPNLTASFWVKTVDTPAFFRTCLYERFLERNETVLILPYGERGNALLWQAETKMYFSMAEGGNGGPDRFRLWPIVSAFTGRSYLPGASRQLKAYLAAHHVTVIIATSDAQARWGKLLATLRVPAVKVGGVFLYRIPPASLRRWAEPLIEARKAFDVYRLLTLMAGAKEYLSNGGSSESLSVMRIAKLNLIRPESLVGPPPLNLRLSSDSGAVRDPNFAYGVFVKGWPGDRVAIGEFTWFPAAKVIAKQLQDCASQMYFPFPDKLNENWAKPPSRQEGALLVVLSREELPCAVTQLRALLDRQPRSHRVGQ